MFLVRVLLWVFAAAMLAVAVASAAPPSTPTVQTHLSDGEVRARLEKLLGPGRRVRDFASFSTERGESALLVLFVTNAIDRSADIKLGEFVSCPEEVAGVPLTGTYHVGLVIDDELINEVSIPPRDDVAGWTPPPELSLPLRNTRFFNDIFYGPGNRVDYDDLKSKEIEPTKLIHLADVNGDGHAWEFRIIDAGDACGHKATLLAGYSAKQRRAIVYAIIKGKELTHWHDNFFPNPGRPPVSKLRYEWLCGDHGSDILQTEEFEYNAVIEAWVRTREDLRLCVSDYVGEDRNTRPTPTPASVEFHPGSASGLPGDKVTVSGRIDSHGAGATGVQLDLSLPWGFAATDCTAQTPARAFEEFQISSSGIHAVLSLSDQIDPVPDSSPLYVCRLQISPHLPPGTYPLIVSGLLVTSDETRLHAIAPDGEIVVLARPTAEPLAETSKCPAPPVTTPEQAICLVREDIERRNPSSDWKGLHAEATRHDDRTWVVRLSNPLPNALGGGGQFTLDAESGRITGGAFEQ